MKKYISEIVAKWLTIVLFVCLLVGYAEYSIGDEQEQIETAAKYYYHGILDLSNDNYKAAVTNFRKSIEEGNNVDAQYELGKCYAYGLGVKQDNAEAHKWFQKAVEQKHIKAMTELGLLCVSDKSEKKDYKESAKWFLKAAKLGDPEAQYKIGEQYFKGLGVEKNQKEGIRWLRTVAKQEYRNAQRMLGIILITGKYGVKKNVAEGIKWLDKVSEKDPTDTTVNLQLYEIYSEGKYVTKDDNKAVNYARKVAAIRQMFFNNELTTTIDNNKYTLSIASTRVAAKKDDDIAQLILGLRYLNEENFKEAQKKLQQSAENGNLDARFILGELYHKNDNNPNETKKQLFELDNKRNEYVQYYLDCLFVKDEIDKLLSENGKELKLLITSLSFSNNKIVKRNTDLFVLMQAIMDLQNIELKEKLMPLAEKGNNLAQVFVGLFYVKIKDYKEAKKWFSKAAEQGDTFGQFSLGVLCSKTGMGIKYSGGGLSFYHYSYGLFDFFKNENFKNDEDETITIKLNLENDEAQKWLTKAAVKNEDTLQVMLSKIYLAENNNHLAKEWLILAADNENDEAQFLLGKLFHENNEKIEVANNLLRESAKKGNENAQLYLDHLYALNNIIAASNQHSINININIGDTKKQNCKKSGLSDTTLLSSTLNANASQETESKTNTKGSIISLGSILSESESNDSSKTNTKFGNIISLGSILSESECNDSPKNSAQSLEVIERVKRSAEKGNTKSQYYLGIIYLCNGDIDEGEKWLLKVADQGNIGAQSVLGQIYRFKNDIKESKKWFKKAAKNGNQYAQHSLGKIHYDEGNYKLARMWLQKAADNGNEDSHLLHLLIKTTPESALNISKFEPIPPSLPLPDDFSPNDVFPTTSENTTPPQINVSQDNDVFPKK
jgi:TPR repeat protein